MEFSIDSYTIKEIYDAKWLKIFDHNSTGGYFFSSKDEVLYSISDNKYSIMKYLPKINRYENGFYEFMLEYPGKSGMNRWKQSASPLDVKIGTSEYDNIIYEKLNNTWDCEGLFSSLVQTNYYDDKAYFAASSNKIKEYWFYAIGAFTNYTYFDTFPAASIYVSNAMGINFLTRRVVLWIRVFSFSDMFNRMCSFKNCMNNNSILYLALFLIIAKN